MNDQKLKLGLKKLSLQGDALSDFVMSLSYVHQEVASALQIAPFAADQQEDDGGVSKDEFMRSLLTSFDSDFNAGGIILAAQSLADALSGFGVMIDLSSAQGEVDSVNLFIKEYGLKEFFADEFDHSAFFEDDSDLNDPESFNDIGDAAIENDLPEYEASESHPMDEAVSSIFESKTEDLAGRTPELSEEEVRKPWVSSKKLPPERSVFLNVNTKHTSFEEDGSKFNYSERLRTAKELSDHVTALNFHPLFRSLGNRALGLTVNSEDLSVALSLDGMASIRRAIKSELDSISKESSIIQADLESAAKQAEGGRIAKDFASYSSKKRALSHRLDDLLSAIKNRDTYVTNLLFNDYREKGFAVDSLLRRREYELSSDFKNRNSILTKTLIEICQSIIFVDIQKEIFHLGSSENIPEQFRENYDAHLAEPFIDEFRHQLGGKIQQFFSRSSAGGWSRDSFCGWMARSIKRRNLCLLVQNKVFNVKTKHWNYSSCAVCGKNIYTRVAITNPKGGGRQEVVDKSEYSEYNIPNYSFFTRDGGVITEGALMSAEDGISERLFPPPEASASGGVEYAGDKTWREIKALITSGSKASHAEGVARRSEALRLLGGRRLSDAISEVSNSKYKCPYSNDSDRPESIAKTRNSTDNKYQPKVKDFECGLYLDPGPILTQGGGVDPKTLQTARPPVEGSPRQLFEAKLDAAIDSGSLLPDEKDKFMTEFANRSGGGWKFSNKFFNCPTKIDIPDEFRSEKGIREQGYLSKFSYIASPISGPVSSGSFLIDEGGSIDQANSLAYPPSDGRGGYSVPEEGTATYLVCGSKTSLSSFLRNPGDEGSLPNILNSLISKAKDDPNLGFRVQAIAETLISLGVDIGDILSFIKKPNSSMELEALAEDVKRSLHKKSEDKGLYERAGKIAQLYSAAMASPANLGVAVRGTPLNRMDLLGDIKLVCGHGHVFSIKDSVFFGKTHTGINFKNKSASAYSPKSIIESGILFQEGSDNFMASLRLRDRSGRRYLQVADETSLIGPDSTRKYRYDEWRGVSKDIKRVIFNTDSGDLYRYGSTPRTFIWGSEEGNEFSSARERESADSSTRVYLDSSSELIDSGGRQDASGNVKGLDAASKAAYAEWKQSEGIPDISSSFSVAARMAANSDTKTDGAGYIEIRGRVGKLLRTFLLSMQGWLKLATTLEIHASLEGKPEAITYDSGDFGSLLSKNTRAAIEAVVRQVEDQEEEVMSAESALLVSKSFEHFSEKYLSQFNNVDRRMLHHSPETVREFISIGLVRSILETIPSVYKDESDAVNIAFRSDLIDGGAVDYESLYEKGWRNEEFELIGPSAGSLIEEVISSLKPDSLSSTDESRILYDPLATGKGSGWYEGGSPAKEGIISKIAKMKGKEYMGRVLEASSAIYIAEVISNAYNLYMKDSQSEAYIGYEIGLDLSSVDKVLSVNHSDLSRLSIGVSEEEAKDMSYEDRLEFYDEHLRNISKCSEVLEESIFALRTACTSSKYMKKATEYITSYLSEMVDEVDADSDPRGVERARLILENVMTNSPFSTISLNSDGKYRKYFGGPGAVDKEKILPSFASTLVKLNSDKQDTLYPIFKLADNSRIYHSFEIDVQKTTSYKECYVLSRYNLPNSIEPSDLNDSLPESYVKNGWRIFLVNMGKGPGEYSDHAGATGTSRANKGWREGVSFLYHPATSEVTGEQDGVIGYSNNEVGINTTETMFVGPLSARRGGQLTFPPNPYNQSHIGVPIPIEYGGVKQTSSDPVFPVIGTRIPVEISSSESMGPVSVDVSDFLQRDPPEEAMNILSKIEGLYEEYLEAIRTAEAMGRSKAEQNAIKLKYKGVISSLHSTYRGLPINVASGGVSTEKEFGSINIHSEDMGRSESFKPSSSLYLPMVDWVTMNRMLSSEVFGPKWGGHQLWSADESDDSLSRRRREAMEEFMIKTNNLELLAESISLKIDQRKGLPSGTTKISARDLLNPVKSLFESNMLSESDIASIFGGAISKSLSAIGSSGAGWTEALKVEGNVQKDMVKNFPRWSMSSGSFYPVGSSSRNDDITGDPLSYIKLMNVVFPSNKAGSDGVSPRERIERARDPESRDILSLDDLYSHEIISGVGSSLSFFPLPEDEKSLKKYKKKLKAVRHIAVARYAEAISEYLAGFVTKSLSPPISTGGVSDPTKEAVSSFGLVKFSEKLNAKMYFGGIINDEGLMHLWNLINK